MAYLNQEFKSKQPQLTKVLLILVMFVAIAMVEYPTPIDYVFGYLYAPPILLVSFLFGQKITVIGTIASIFITILNLWIPGQEIIKTPTIANRIIAIVALIITAFLSETLRRDREKIALTQSQLKARDKLMQIREDFASTITHDLKTPLLGAIEIIKAFEKEQFGPIVPDQIKILSTIVRSHQNSLELLETLLDIYRNDTEGLNLNLVPIDLAVIIREVTINLNELAANRQICLSVSYKDSDFQQSLWVNGDPLQLKRVISNLIVNAINHSPRGDRVEILLEPQISSQIIRILDSGRGIKTEHFAHLFDRFYQSNTDRETKGFGLGLYLSRQIIEAHGGIIWAENRIPSGAVFSFKLPVLPYLDFK
jgi:two-component system NarL family sensor kinase